MCPTFNGLAFTRSRSREIACGQHGWNLWARVEGQKNQSQVLTSADGGVPNPGEPVKRESAYKRHPRAFPHGVDVQSSPWEGLEKNAF